MLIVDTTCPTHSQLQLELTLILLQSFGDLTEDPAVTGDHDGQRQQEQAGEGEHVVGRLMPVSEETLVCRALGELCRMGDGHTVEKQHLKRAALLEIVWVPFMCLVSIL